MNISQVLIHLKNFIEKNKIEDLRIEFVDLPKIAHQQYSGQVYSCEWDKDNQWWDIEYSTQGDNFKIKETFDSYLLSYLNNYFAHIENELINFHIDKQQPQFRDLLMKLEMELLSLSKLALMRPDEYLSSLIKSFKTRIIDKYMDDKLSTPSIDYRPKIQWLGTYNTLSTFLLDYSTSNNNLGMAIMQRDIRAFKHLMLTCFVDEKGNQFSKSTIDTYFSPNKIGEKRSKKNEITLKRDEPQYVEAEEVVKQKKKNSSPPKAYALPKEFNKPSTKTS